jgi:hypothetical protein
MIALRIQELENLVEYRLRRLEDLVREGFEGLRSDKCGFSLLGNHKSSHIGRLPVSGSTPSTRGSEQLPCQHFQMNVTEMIGRTSIRRTDIPIQETAIMEQERGHSPILMPFGELRQAQEVSRKE